MALHKEIWDSKHKKKCTRTEIKNYSLKAVTKFRIAGVKNVILYLLKQKRFEKKPHK